ncbi:MAG: NUDIX domain-containing protein [Labedaea sp.]
MGPKFARQTGHRVGPARTSPPCRRLGDVTNPAEKFATPRIASGALFVDGSRVLLVRKTYGNRWDIPGGYVDHGESPAAGCRREVREELGLEFAPTRLLVHDWAPSEGEGDKILYVFGCGESRINTSLITLDGVELDRWKWVAIDQLSDLVIPRLARRLARAHEAHRTSSTLYLEHGEVAL